MKAYEIVVCKIQNSISIDVNLDYYLLHFFQAAPYERPALSKGYLLPECTYHHP